MVGDIVGVVYGVGLNLPASCRSFRPVNGGDDFVDGLRSHLTPVFECS